MAKKPATTSSRAKKRSPTEIIVALAERLASCREKLGHYKAKAEGLEQIIDLNNRVVALESASKQVPPIQPNSQEGLMAQNDNNSTTQHSRMDRIKNGWRIAKKYSTVAALFLIGVVMYSMFSWLFLSSNKQDVAQTPPAAGSVLTKSDMETFVKAAVKAEVEAQMLPFEQRSNARIETALKPILSDVADLKKSPPVSKPTDTLSKSSTLGPSHSLEKWKDYDSGDKLGVMYLECKDENWGVSHEKEVRAVLAKTNQTEIIAVLKSCKVEDLFKVKGLPVPRGLLAQAPQGGLDKSDDLANTADQAELSEDDLKTLDQLIRKAEKS